MQLVKDELDLTIDKIKTYLLKIKQQRNYTSVKALLNFMDGYNFMSEEISPKLFTYLDAKCIKNNIIVSIYEKSKIGRFHVSELIGVVNMEECSDVSE